MITKTIQFSLLTLALSSLFGCGEAKIETAGTDSVDTVKKAVATVQKASLINNDDQKVYDQYLVLKDALVASDAAVSKAAAEALKPMLKGSALDEAEKIAVTDDLKIQRLAFTKLSDLLIAKFKKSEISSGKIFVQRCPMANSGDGGEWLAAESNIRNPYYGDEMMECGAVIEELKSK